jgi:hypothetical protein
MKSQENKQPAFDAILAQYNNIGYHIKIGNDSLRWLFVVPAYAPEYVDAKNVFMAVMA